MKDANAGKSFLEDIGNEIKSLWRFILIIVIFYTLISIVVAHIYRNEFNSLYARVSALESKMTQQESLTREALGADHKQRIQAVYDGKHINY